MRVTRLILLGITLLSLLAAGTAPAVGQTKFLSHPPMRPLPVASSRPIDKGAALFVDPSKGGDTNAGSEAKPWKTLGHAVQQLKPGDTLYLRGGTYYEHVTVKCSGEAGKPIAIRTYLGELAILDGGLREVHENPTTAWEPCPDGAPGEFRSTKTYPKLAEGILLGNFGDSMIPLHGYRSLEDMRSKNEYWPPEKREDPMYCGPGLWYDAKTGRIHIRLAHTSLPMLDKDNYRGETDPRKLSLVLARSTTPLRIEGAKHLRIHDLVVRGSNRPAIHLIKAEDMELDGVTAYGGSTAMTVEGCTRLKIVNCALRGISAPWSARYTLKYKGMAAYLFWAKESPLNRDLEIAHCEMTDSHDGPFLGPIKGLKFHHNLVDNHNDDGIYLTAMGVGGDLHIYQNVLSRCLSHFSFFGKYPTGSGVYIYRNVIDMRPPVAYHAPKAADDPDFKPFGPGKRTKGWPGGWLCGEHGSPVWEPIFFYHNSVLADSGDYMKHVYGLGWGWHTHGTKRRLFNNIFLQIEGNPSLAFRIAPEDDLQADGNLFWGLVDGPSFKGDFFAEFRKSKTFAASKKHSAAGWGSQDQFGDPKFAKLSLDWRAAVDLRLQSGSAALDAGVDVPADWLDPLRKHDKGKPDIGAFPVGSEPLRVGINGRITVSPEKASESK